MEAFIRKVEEELRQSEERCLTLFEGNPLPMWVLDAETLSFLAVNEAAIRHYGYSREEFLAMVPKDLHPPGENASLFKYPSTPGPGLNAPALGRHRKKDGTVIEVEVIPHPILWAGRSAWLIFANDITELGRAEEALAASEKRYRLLLDRNLAGVLRSTTAGRILECNAALVRMFGYASRQEVLALETWDLYLNREQREIFLAGLRKQGILTNFEVRCRRKDGAPLWVLENASLIEEKEGEPAVVEATVVDITERKQAEEALLQLSGRLLQLQDEERRRMARELHDSTAQSLAALVMNLSQLGKLLPALDPQMGNLASDSLALAELCFREIRTLSYLLHPPLLDEMGLGSAVRWFLDGFSQRSGVYVQLDVSPELTRLPQEVETALFRVIQESLTNIHRHSGSSTARVRLVQKDAELTLEISDEGQGILLGALPALTGKIAGLGVGIMGMRERMAQLGGRLEIHSTPQGTTVRAVLRVARREP